MKIAQVAPLFESVPPQRYGGTERVVSYLTEALIEWLKLSWLQIGTHSVDLQLKRYQNDGVGIEMLRKDGPVEVRVTV